MIKTKPTRVPRVIPPLVGLACGRQGPATECALVHAAWRLALGATAALVARSHDGFLQCPRSLAFLPSPASP